MHQSLIELITIRLRDQINLIRHDNEITRYYIFAFSTYGITEAVPFIKSTLFDWKNKKESILWACFISLSRLNPEDAKPLLSLLLEYDNKMGYLLKPNQGDSYDGLTYRVLINQWEFIGVDGLKAMLRNIREWTGDQRVQVYLLIADALQRNYKIFPEDKQDIQKLVKESLDIS